MSRLLRAEYFLLELLGLLLKVPLRLPLGLCLLAEPILPSGSLPRRVLLPGVKARSEQLFRVNSGHHLSDEPPEGGGVHPLGLLPREFPGQIVLADAA